MTTVKMKRTEGVNRMQELFNDTLKCDVKNIRTVRTLLGDDSPVMATPERRAMFVIGYLNPHLSYGCYFENVPGEDEDEVEFLGIKMEGGSDNDPYYMSEGIKMANSTEKPTRFFMDDEDGDE